MDLELALLALRDAANEEGLTPARRIPKEAYMSPQGVIRAALGVSERRSESIVHKLRKMGFVIPTEGSTKVIITDMMPDINQGVATPQPGVVTIERIRAAIFKLQQANEHLREENLALKERVKTLEERVDALSESSELARLLEDIENAA